jgi:Bacteriophage CI repressor helix-turn-helix domain
MRTFDATATIERAKKIQGLKTDSSLAEWLDVSRTSLASWKRRGSIPAKHLFRMVAGTDETVDWLTSSDEPLADDLGFTKTNPMIDERILWLALLLYRRDLSGLNGHEKELAELLTDDDLAGFAIQINNYVTLMTATKEKWERSGVVKGKDVYRAIATEFDLGFFHAPPTLWWEDDSIV